MQERETYESLHIRCFFGKKFSEFEHIIEGKARENNPNNVSNKCKRNESASKDDTVGDCHGCTLEYVHDTEDQSGDQQLGILPSNASNEDDVDNYADDVEYEDQVKIGLI